MPIFSWAKAGMDHTTNNYLYFISLPLGEQQHFFLSFIFPSFSPPFAYFVCTKNKLDLWRHNEICRETMKPEKHKTEI